MWLWHERYGHLHFEALRKLKQQRMVDGLPHVEHIHPHMWVMLLAAKNDTLVALKAFQASIGSTLRHTRRSKTVLLNQTVVTMHGS